ncbi:formylglycine-generating enzyme family protein [Accumulibacter sp.]|uniref:formylglycine-generating enzyme family protein n=1 Tax=Accumulibacter sp. TaxID=2053492 RepID=UPI0025855212|nr:formylglycine-generating enzyme family protein [Accumulibacter sp.]
MPTRVPHSRATVGRADLLRIYAAEGDEALARAAAALGYQRRPRAPAPPPVVDSGSEDTRGDEPVVGSAPAVLPERPPVLPKARFFRVVEHRWREPEADARVGPPPPPWLANARVLGTDARPPAASLHLPPRQPLTRWSRLWPFLRSVLGRRLATRQPDLPRLLERLTRGDVLRAIPLLPGHGWSPRIALLGDYSRRTRPFHEDFNALCQALEKRHGKAGIDRWILAGDPGRQPRVRQPGGSTTARWPLPAPNTPLLILGDAGLLDDAPEAANGWQQFGHRLRGAGVPALVLCPLPTRPPGAGPPGSLALVEWDRHSRLRPSSTSSTGSRPPATLASDLAGDERRQNALDTLLTLLAPAVVIEPSLLRALRYLLPTSDADGLVEALVWQHPDLVTSAHAGQFASPAAIAAYQRKFRALAPWLRQAAVAKLLAQHAGLPASVRYAEVLACRHLAPEAVPPALAADAERWQADIAETARRRDDLALRQWLQRHAARQSDAALAADPALAAHWALAQRERLAAGAAVELPEGVSEEDIGYFLHDEHEPAPRLRCTLRQRGDELWLEAADAAGKVSGGSGGSPCAELTLVDRGVQVTLTGSADRAEMASRRYFAAGSLPQRLARLTREVERLTLHSKHLDLAVRPLVKPVWANAIGCDARGLYVELFWRGQRCRLDWRPPEGGGDSTGAWSGEQPLGVDRYGLFGEIAVAGVTQRFRWIAPGTFRMGSPEEEPERYEDEVPHEVTLSEGYWLADTACTEALWQAVTGRNPSGVKDQPELPVEQVSWDDVQDFLGELNRRLPGLEARLPSEAEWEYACRAGTTTPFSLGENITPEQVNYDGNHPYAGGVKGVYRLQTVPVGSLPANPWGLYEMHGNVCEWCADWYGDYPTTPQVDPRGAPSGDARVFRGGSCNYFGRDVRSAVRRRREPGGHYGSVGFRLALGPGKPAEPA